MGTVKKLAEEVQRGLKEALPKVRKTVVKKLSLAVGAMREARTPNTVALARYWCVSVGRHDAQHNPTPLERKAQAQTDPDHWSVKKVWRSLLSWVTRGLRLLRRCLQINQPLPPFSMIMRN